MSSEVFIHTLETPILDRTSLCPRKYHLQLSFLSGNNHSYDTFSLVLSGTLSASSTAICLRIGYINFILHLGLISLGLSLGLSLLTLFDFLYPLVYTPSIHNSCSTKITGTAQTCIRGSNWTTVSVVKFTANWTV